MVPRLSPRGAKCDFSAALDSKEAVPRFFKRTPTPSTVARMTSPLTSLHVFRAWVLGELQMRKRPTQIDAETVRIGTSRCILQSSCSVPTHDSTTLSWSSLCTCSVHFRNIKRASGCFEGRVQLHHCREVGRGSAEQRHLVQDLGGCDVSQDNLTDLHSAFQGSLGTYHHRSSRWSTRQRTRRHSWKSWRVLVNTASKRDHLWETCSDNLKKNHEERARYEML